MTLFDIEKTIFLIIDIQEKLLNAVFNKEEVLKNSKILAEASRLLSIPTIVTEQYPKGLGSTVEGVKECLNNEVQYLEKNAFSALRVENIKEALTKYNKKQVILCGIETHICVYQTALELINEGYEVTLVKNACGSRSEYEYDSAIEDLRFKGVSIKTAEMVLFELLKTSKHPNFKEIQTLIK